jgi:c-di-GMP-binding flagellar brake protein YcgR
MATSSGLNVRQHERQGLEMPVEFVIAPPHGTQVRFSSSSSAAGPAVIRGEAMDISSGGMGVRCGHLVPRMCDGTVRILRPAGGERGEKDGSSTVAVFEHAAKVCRVTMIGREPVYAIGLAFIDADADLEQRIATLMDGAGGADA